jgi:hypothetical protein
MLAVVEVERGLVLPEVAEPVAAVMLAGIA